LIVHILEQSDRLTVFVHDPVPPHVAGSPIASTFPGSTREPSDLIERDGTALRPIECLLDPPRQPGPHSSDREHASESQRGPPTIPTLECGSEIVDTRSFKKPCTSGGNVEDRRT
jgi:hypothetical protein